MKINHTPLGLLLSFSLTLLLAGCGNDNLHDLREKLQKIKRESAEIKKPNFIAGLQLPKPVSYQSELMRSESSFKQGDSANPLQNFPLNTLKYIGTLFKENQLFAYILTPDNMIYSVKAGDLIGDQNGRINKINPEQLDIVENRLENGKKPKQEIVTLKLKE